MNRAQWIGDSIVVLVAIVSGFTIVAIGGVFHPNTLAGAVARFVFSLS